MARRRDLIDATNDKENSTVTSNTTIKTYKPYIPDKGSTRAELIKNIRAILKHSIFEKNEKTKYLKSLREECPTLYGEKGKFPNLVDELLAELSEAERHADTIESAHQFMVDFGYIENPRRSEQNSDDWDDRPNNTFGRPTPKKKNKRPKAVPQPLESLFEDSYTKFFTIPASAEIEDDITLDLILLKQVGKDVTFYSKHDRSRVVTVRNAEQAQAMKELFNNKGTTIPVQKNQVLNSCTGTIAIQSGVLFGRRIFESKETEEALKEILRERDHEVINVSCYTIPPRTRNKYPTNVAKITFDGWKLPSKVNIAGVIHDVREKKPTPLQCRSCWRFGHPQKYCRSSPEGPRCPRCAEPDHSREQCAAEIPVCRNCEGPHPAYDNKCPRYKFESEVAAVRAREGMSLRAARSRCREMGFTPYLHPAVTAHSSIPEHVSSSEHPNTTHTPTVPTTRTRQQSRVPAVSAASSTAPGSRSGTPAASTSRTVFVTPTSSTTPLLSNSYANLDPDTPTTPATSGHSPTEQVKGLPQRPKTKRPKERKQRKELKRRKFKPTTPNLTKGPTLRSPRTLLLVKDQNTLHKGKQKKQPQNDATPKDSRREAQPPNARGGAKRKERQESTSPRSAKVPAKATMEQSGKLQRTGVPKKDDDYESMNTDDEIYEEISSDENIEKVRKFVRETQPPNPSQCEHASTEETTVQIHPPPEYLPNTPMPPEPSQYQPSAPDSGTRNKILTKTSEEPRQKEVRGGNNPSPEPSSGGVVPTEPSQGELSASLPDLRVQMPPEPTSTPGWKGVQGESRSPPACQLGAAVPSVHTPSHLSTSHSNNQDQIPTEPPEIPKKKTTPTEIGHRRSLLSLPMPPGTKSESSPRAPTHEEHRQIEAIVTNRR